MILFLALLLVQAAAGAERDRMEVAEADRLFALAGDLYEDGDYEAAAATYTSILDGGWTSGALNHNTGRAYLRAGRLGPAVLHLERAAQHLPTDPVVQAHLGEARAQVESSGDPSTASSLTGIAGSVADVLTLGGLLALTLLTWFSALALLGWRVWRGDRLAATQRVRVRRGLLVAVPLAVLLLTATVWASVERYAARAVVLEPMPIAYTPGGAQDGAAIAEGLVVQLGSAQGSWQAIVLPDGTEGWLPRTALGRI